MCQWLAAAQLRLTMSAAAMLAAQAWSWQRAMRKGHPWAGVSMSWRRSAHLAELLVSQTQSGCLNDAPCSPCIDTGHGSSASVTTGRPGRRWRSAWRRRRRCSCPTRESFMRAHWVAVPKAVRARRVNRWINYTDAAFGWNTLYAGLSVVSYGLSLSILPRLLVGRVGEVGSQTRQTLPRPDRQTRWRPCCLLSAAACLPAAVCLSVCLPACLPVRLPANRPYPWAHHTPHLWRRCCCYCCCCLSLLVTACHSPPRPSSTQVRAMSGGLLVLACGFCLLAAAGWGGRRWAWLVWPTVFVCAGGCCFDSAMRTYISRLVADQEQGSLQVGGQQEPSPPSPPACRCPWLRGDDICAVAAH
jgi:hypothetical protein